METYFDLDEERIPVRSSTFIDMPVWLVTPAEPRLEQAERREMGVVRDVLYAIDTRSGMFDERLKVIVEIINGPRGGMFVDVFLSRLRRRY